MKIKNTLRIGLPIILVMFMLMAMFGDFLPTPEPQSNPSVLEYSDKTQMYSSLYDMAQSEWKTSASELEIAQQTYNLAIQTEKAKKEAFCLNWFLLAQAKWSDTPSYMEDELNRLEEGMKQAKACSFNNEAGETSVKTIPTVEALTPSELPSTSNIISNVYFTSYNPEAGQTDSTPCIAGGTSMDLCELAKQGIRTIALSQELIAWSSYGDETDLKAGQKVTLTSTDFPDDPRCNGEFTVADAMNARFRGRGDLFFLSRSDNISCHANISF